MYIYIYMYISHQYTRPGERLQFAMERSTTINGKNHYFDWAIFNCFLLVHQRVPLRYQQMEVSIKVPQLDGLQWNIPQKNR